MDKVYDELCAMGGFEKQKAIQENLDKKREPGVKGFCKWFFGGIADGVSGCVVPLIPFIMVAGILLGAMLVHPDFMAMAASMEPVSFNVYGISCTLVNYSQTIVPMILATWVMGYVSGFSKSTSRTSCPPSLPRC